MEDRTRNLSEGGDPEKDTVREKTENKRDEEGRLYDSSSLRSSLLNRRKKRDNLHAP